MRLLADENIAASLVQLLRDQGIDVLYVAELDPGLKDNDVVTLAIRERRSILTEDRDFGDLVFRQKRGVPGIVMLRLKASPNDAWSRVVKILKQQEARIPGNYLVIGSDRIRIRQLPEIQGT